MEIIKNEKKLTIICTSDVSFFSNEIKKIEKREALQNILIFTFSGERYVIKCNDKSDLNTKIALLQDAMIESNETSAILKFND